jgi:hypothetical protein
MQRHIIFTRADRSVAVVTASRSWMHVVRNGGYPWYTDRGSIDRAIENRIRAGVPEDAARRHVRACAFGGCSTGEAMEIIRDNAMDINNGVLSLTAFALLTSVILKSFEVSIDGSEMLGGDHTMEGQ